jgi:hypothetical protein
MHPVHPAFALPLLPRALTSRFVPIRPSLHMQKRPMKVLLLGLEVIRSLHRPVRFCLLSLPLQSASILLRTPIHRSGRACLPFHSTYSHHHALMIHGLLEEINNRMVSSCATHCSQCGAHVATSFPWPWLRFFATPFFSASPCIPCLNNLLTLADYISLPGGHHVATTTHPCALNNHLRVSSSY